MSTSLDDGHTFPFRGTDIARIATESLRRPYELHITKDQFRAFVQDRLIGGRWHEAASQAAMLALNTSEAATADAPGGCFPMDFCFRSDLGTMWICRTNRGALLTDWKEFATTGEANTASNLGSGTGVFASKSGVDLRLKSLVAGSGVSISATGTEITIASSNVADARDSWLLG